MGAACEHGIATAAIRNSLHIGRLGEFAERAVARGLAAIVTYGTAAPDTGLVAPFGGRRGSSPRRPLGDHACWYKGHGRALMAALLGGLAMNEAETTDARDREAQPGHCQVEHV